MDKKEYKYTVSANLYSAEANDYIYHWEGAGFDDEDAARNFWNNWMPPDCAIKIRARAWMFNGHLRDNFDIEVGMWDDEGNEYEFESVCVNPDDIYVEEFSALVRDRVEAMGWSYAKLARETGLAVRTIRSYLNHERVPGAIAFRNICNVLGIDPLSVYFKKEEQL